MGIVSRSDGLLSRRQVIVGGAATLALPLAGCGGASGNSGGTGGDRALTLGATGPMTGTAAAWGLAMKQAAQMAAWEANQNGGLEVGGQKWHVAVASYDDQYTSNGAAEAMNEFASQGIKFVIGPMGSPEVTGAKPIAKRHDMLLMADSFAKNAIGPQWPLVFHIGPGPGVWAEPIIEVTQKSFPMKSVVTIAPNDQGGQDIAEVDAKAYEASGVTVQNKVYYERGTSDFAPVVTRALASHPDAVDTASSPPGDAGVIVKQLRQAGFKGPIGHLGGPGTEEIAKGAGGYEALGDFYYYQPYNPQDPKVQEFQRKVKKVLGAEAQPNTTLWAPGARMVLKAISKAGTAEDTQAVAKALRNIAPTDPVLGKGVWTGQEEFGINQELSFPFYLGLYKGGERQPYTKLEAEK